MLTITASQLALLQVSMDQALRGQLLQQIRRDHPVKAQGRDDAALHQYIDVMLSFCKAMRIERLPTIRRLFDLQLRHGFHPSCHLRCAGHLSSSPSTRLCGSTVSSERSRAGSRCE